MYRSKNWGKQLAKKLSILLAAFITTLALVFGISLGSPPESAQAYSTVVATKQLASNYDGTTHKKIGTSTNKLTVCKTDGKIKARTEVTKVSGKLGTLTLRVHVTTELGGGSYGKYVKAGTVGVQSTSGYTSVKLKSNKTAIYVRVDSEDLTTGSGITTYLDKIVTC